MRHHTSERWWGYGPGLLCLLTGALSQELTVAAIEDSMVARFNRVEDYTVQVKISVTMPRFRMPAKRVKLYYKRPDRVKVEAEGFAVVPRTGLTFSPSEMMDNLFAKSVSGIEKREDGTYWIVEGRLHPDSMKINLFHGEMGEDIQPGMKLWINGEGWFISRAETRLDTVTVMAVESTFREQEKDIWLPEETQLKFFMPGDYLARMGDREPMGGPFGETHGEMEGKFEGSVRLEFSRYRINRGLKDKIFEKTTF